MRLRIVVALAAMLAAMSAANALDPNFPAYQTTTGISGHVKSVGSDTLNNEMALWAREFMNRRRLQG
jgi:phosphate transport system substrate-binding protein